MGELGMRNDKVSFLYPSIAEAHNVEVQRPGVPPLHPFAALLALDCLASLEQSPGLQSGLEKDHLVQVRGLVHAAEREGLLDSGGGDE
jgi:hypothetical protein